jgi:Arc/MetJ-type ribon-helix-helix transcriptional regulator
MSYNSGMQVQISNPRLAKFIDDKVRAGEFANAEALVEDAVARVMEEQETLTEEDLREIELSRQEIARGEFVDFDTFATEMRKKYGVK